MSTYFKTINLCVFLIIAALLVRGQQKSLPVWSEANEVNHSSDWLIKTSGNKAMVYQANNQKDIVLSNGLVKRSFRMAPNLACIDYKNMSNGQQLLRAVKPEAEVTINDKTYNVGGLKGQRENAYLIKKEIDNLTSGENDFIYQEYKIGQLPTFVNWKAGEFWASNKNNPTGLLLSFKFISNLAELKGVVVNVNYALYDNLPLIAKWVTINNQSNQPIKVNQVKNEILGLVEEESAVVGDVTNMSVQHGIYFESNYAFNNAMKYSISDQTSHWKKDSTYTSQVNYGLRTPCLFENYGDKGINITLNKNEVFTSIRTNELLIDSYDRERKGLSIRKMYSTIAPWTTENPIFMHVVSKTDEQVFKAIDQCAETGYEALIVSFGSHLNMEDSSANNIKRWKEIATYAHHKNVKIGGYSLFSSRKISDADDVINPLTGKTGGAFFGNAPCFGSKWGLAYRDKIKHFYTQTGFDIWENDGPYVGDVCASTTHPGHKDLEDSQWAQIEIQKELYHWLNERGVYINAPDWYFLDGTNKIGLGYREVNFSLPRENQKILNRQNIFDGTWEKTASMSWGFVPLTAYQGGGKEAVLEPLSEHLDDYKQLMMQYYGAGVQACYRGPRLYDTEITKQTVIEVVNWYKKYRDILNSDIIHLRRPDGRDWDGILHVNPTLKTKALLMAYNPLNVPIQRKIKVPLYYAGINNAVKITDDLGKVLSQKVSNKQEVELTISLKPESYNWYVFE